jgi:1,4-alpha-glucan branching enzyme
VGEAPSVAGDFTDWSSVRMTRVDGEWEASFQLAPGVYHYSFQRADGSWFLPDSVQNRVDDGFGGANGVLVVTEP